MACRVADCHGLTWIDHCQKEKTRPVGLGAYIDYPRLQLWLEVCECKYESDTSPVHLKDQGIWK